MTEIKIGLIGGSGLGEAMGGTVAGVRHDVATPFGSPSDAIIETQWHGVPVFILARHGSGHTLAPSQVPYRANVFALKQLGVTHVIASGAVGSLREEFRPRDLVIPDQVIDRTHQRACSFFENAAVHVEFSEPFCPVLRRILLEAGRLEDSEVGAQGSEVGGQGSGVEGPSSEAEVQGSEVSLQSSAVAGQEPAASSPNPARPTSNAEPSTLNPEPGTPNPLRVHGRGCYVCMEGPAFSTRAESLMHRLWGGDLIGMTAMPEAKLAREAEMSYALVALVTDYDCWRRPPAVQAAVGARVEGAGGAGGALGVAPQAPHVLLEEIIANLQAASDNGVRLIRRAVQHMAGQREEMMAAPAQAALKLAIWSDKSQIPRDEVERLAPLWGKYFDEGGRAT